MHRSTPMQWMFLVHCLCLLFNHGQSANIRSRIGSPSACLSLYMLDGAPGTPSANQQKEAADAEAAVRAGRALIETMMTARKMTAAAPLAAYTPPTSLIETFRSTQRTHLQNCRILSSNGAEPCHEALPSALNLIKTHLKHEATKWFNDECNELKDRLAQRGSFGELPDGGEKIMDLVECKTECTESIVAMDRYLQQRDNAIKTILTLDIESLSEEEKRIRKEQCHDDMDKFKEQDKTVTELWGACQGRIDVLRKRLDTAVKQKFLFPNGFYDILGLPKTATAEEIKAVCDKKNKDQVLLEISGDINVPQNAPSDTTASTGGTEQIATEYFAKDMDEDISVACGKLQDEEARKKYDATEIGQNVELYDMLIGPEERSFVCEPIPKSCDDDEKPVLNPVTKQCEGCPPSAPKWNPLIQKCQPPKPKQKPIIQIKLKCPGMCVCVPSDVIGMCRSVIHRQHPHFLEHQRWSRPGCAAFFSGGVMRRRRPWHRIRDCSCCMVLLPSMFLFLCR